MPTSPSLLVSTQSSHHLHKTTTVLCTFPCHHGVTTRTMEHSFIHFLVPKPPPPFVLLTCNDSDLMGVSCNISTSPCALLSPCLNQATCTANKTSPHGYLCHCPSSFQGSDCEIDTRPCKPDTCRNSGTLLYRHHLTSHDCLGTCFNTSASEFRCQCAEGWTSTHCETMVNHCVNVTCQNNGVCQPLFRDYRCACSSSGFSGRHCEITAGSLAARQIVSRSFAYVAIVCLVGVFVLVLALDILKYVFHVDDTTSKDHQRKLKQSARKTKKPAVAIRFQYVSPSPTHPHPV